MAYIEFTDKHLGWFLLVAGVTIVGAGVMAGETDIGFTVGLFGGVLAGLGIVFLNKVYGIIGMKY